MKLSPLSIRRLENFKTNKEEHTLQSYLQFFFTISIFAEFIANDKPIFLVYENKFYFPVVEKLPETFFGGEFETEADYKDPFVQDLINQKGFYIMPLIEYSYDTINYDLKVPSPSPPTFENILGTDDQGRDVMARLIYGFRISVFFGLILTILSSFIGIISWWLTGFLWRKS